MPYTELDLAQVERRVLASERCVERQLDIVVQHLAAAQPAEAALQRLAEFEAALASLRRERNHIRTHVIANTQRPMQAFRPWLAEQRRSRAA